MSRTYPEVHDSPAADPLLLADVLLRQEPDEDEDEDEKDGEDEDDNNEDGSDGYSE
jgi:hypothetical protein